MPYWSIASIEKREINADIAPLKIKETTNFQLSDCKFNYTWQIVYITICI